MTSACTYDPISKKGYAISIDDDKKYRFNSVNLEDGKLTPILIDMPVHLLTLASNSAGYYMVYQKKEVLLCRQKQRYHL